MPVVTRRELLEAGVHFGHQTRRWNPKMGRYLYGERSGIYILDLEKTLTGLDEAYSYTRDVARRGGVLLFIARRGDGKKGAASTPAVAAGTPAPQPSRTERVAVTAGRGRPGSVL